MAECCICGTRPGRRIEHIDEDEYSTDIIEEHEEYLNEWITLMHCAECGRNFCSSGPCGHTIYQPKIPIRTFCIDCGPMIEERRGLT